MSFRTSRQNVTTESKIMETPPVSPVWVRNPEWMTMPATTAAQEQVDILVAVYPESSYIALSFQTNVGTYTVDWGDGTAPVTVTSNVAAQYLYDYNSPGLTGPGTLPYKQAMIKVTPTTGGALLAGNTILNSKNSTANLQNYTQPILDMTLSGSFAALNIGGGAIPLRLMERCTILRHNAISGINWFSGCYALQSVPLFNASALTSVAAMFQDCRSLQVIPQLNIVAANSTQNMFSGCSNLQSLPLLNTIFVQNMSGMFTNCTNLKSVPLFNTAVVTSMSSMFSGCTDLEEVPLFNTASVTSMQLMFQNCNSLKTIPLFNTAAVTTMAGMFNSCVSLLTVPLFNTANVTAMGGLSTLGMFMGCTSLQSVPLFNTANVTTMQLMFNGCVSLLTVPLFNTANVTNMTSMFQGATALQTVPLFNTANVTTFSNMFATCSSLQLVPAFATNATTGTTAFTAMFNGCSNLQTVGNMNFNVPAITTTASYSNMVSGCPSLSRIGDGTPNTGPKFTFTVASCKLSAAALNALYTSLPTVTGQTITVSSNVGISGDDPTIATAKGWTVTGS